MFTGIIEGLGEVVECRRHGDGLVLGVGNRFSPGSVQLGESVAVNGVCLTVSNLQDGALGFDIGPETLFATTLQFFKPGDRVHLERALSFGGRLGGHLVTGHVDGVGEVVARKPRGPNLDLVLLAPSSITCYLVSKGSVAVDGVSLTINHPQADRFRVTLVPHTLEKTLLGGHRPGNRINLEADLLGKYVMHFLERRGAGKLTEQFLAEHGFLAPNRSGGRIGT